MTSKSVSAPRPVRPFLSYLQQYQLRHALTPSQVADWLQVALWAGQDDEVVKVWRRYQVYMPIPAWGTAAAAQALRATRSSGKPRSPSGSRHSARPWQRRLSYRLYQNARRCPQGRRGAQRSASPGGGAGERCAPADALLSLRLGKSWTSCWWTRRSSIVNRKTKLRWPA